MGMLRQTRCEFQKRAVRIKIAEEEEGAVLRVLRRRRWRSQSTCASFYNTSTNEFETIYSNAIHDYIASSNQTIGVIRSFDTADGLRCFANTSAPCAAPSNATFVPEGIPVIIGLQKIAGTDLAPFENSNGSPKGIITGSFSPQHGQYTPFANNYMNGGCLQSGGNWTYAFTEVIYATAIDFKGDIGVKDAVIVDEYEMGPPAHVERYFYVHGYGRVREGSANFDSNTLAYDMPVPGQSSTDNENRNHLLPRDFSKIPNSPTQCPQGGTDSLQR